MSDLCNPELLEKIADGSATPAERAEVDAHAIECVTCAHELAWQRREHALFAARRTRAVAPLWKDVEARIAAPMPRRPARWIAGAVAAAAAILLLVKSVPMALHHDASKVVVVPAAALVEPAKGDHQAWDFSLEGVERILVHDIAGSVVLRPTDRAALHVVANPDGALGGWAIRVERNGKEITARVECAHSCKDAAKVHFLLEVPIRAPLPKISVDTISASVRADLVPSVVLHTVSGDVHAQGAGPLHVSTTSGNVRVANSPSTLMKIDTVSGDVTWAGTCEKDCDLQIATVSGDVGVTPDRESHYDVETRSHASSHGRVRDGAAGKIRVTTVSGDIEVPDDEVEHAEHPYSVAGFTAIEPSRGLVAEADIDVADVATIHVGEHVEVDAKGGLGSTRGVVVAIDKEDEQRGTCAVTIDVPDGWAKPGISVLCKFGVDAEDAISIGTASGGLVRSVDVKVGDEVQKGQVVARLDTSAAEAELAAVDAEVSAVELDLKRAEQLFKGGAVTIAQVAQAKAAVALARAKRAEPERRLAMARVRTLTHGYVTRVLVRPGQTVAPNSPLVTISAKK